MRSEPLAEQVRRTGGGDSLVIAAMPQMDVVRRGLVCRYDQSTHPVAVGLTTSRVIGNRPEVPATDQVGWLSNSARPGSRHGVAALAGHLTNGSQGASRGPLWGAECLQEGAVIRVVWHGKTLPYRVTAVTKHARGALPPALLDPNGASRIAIVSCTGPYRYNATRKDFYLSQNSVVWAEKV